MLFWVGLRPSRHGMAQERHAIWRDRLTRYERQGWVWLGMRRGPVRRHDTAQGSWPVFGMTRHAEPLPMTAHRWHAKPPAVTVDRRRLNIAAPARVATTPPHLCIADPCRAQRARLHVAASARAPRSPPPALCRCPCSRARWIRSRWSSGTPRKVVEERGEARGSGQWGSGNKASGGGWGEGGGWGR